MIEVNNQSRNRIDTKLLLKVAQKVLRGERRKKATLSIAILEPKKMRELNKIYRGKNEVANVLSFPFHQGAQKNQPLRSGKELGLGEICICPSRVKRDAKKYGILFQRALSWMLIHGILHLLNYSHRTKLNAQKMEQKETSYLKIIHS
ncbi:MAG: rRNA maturation RNase YbeY [Patescibacteria group bacterium]